MHIPDFNTRAELVLNQFDFNPETDCVDKAGRFYRGYCHDIMEADASVVTLARNGLMHFLPEGLFYDEEYLREYNPNEDQKKRQEHLSRIKKLHSLFFRTFDNVVFRQEFAMEKKVEEMEIQRDAILLEEIYGFDLRSERDPYVARLAVLRIHAPQLKGNVIMLAHFVSAILGEKVSAEMEKRIVDVRGRSEQVPRITFIIEIPRLTTDAYNKKMEEYELFFALLTQWFMPFDIESDYGIKDRRQNMILGEQLILDYNTQLF